MFLLVSLIGHFPYEQILITFQQMLKFLIGISKISNMLTASGM